MEVRRNRLLYALLALCVIGLGLASRHYASLLPLFLRKSAGDALWALMVFVLCGLLFPRRPTRWTAGAALAFSVLIEFSQIYHAPWIDAIRAYPLGHLVLGSGFAWGDMVCYAVGVAVGVGGEWLCRNRMPHGLQSAQAPAALPPHPAATQEDGPS